MIIIYILEVKMFFFYYIIFFFFGCFVFIFSFVCFFAFDGGVAVVVAVAVA